MERDSERDIPRGGLSRFIVTVDFANRIWEREVGMVGSNSRGVEGLIEYLKGLDEQSPPYILLRACLLAEPLVRQTPTGDRIDPLDELLSSIGVPAEDIEDARNAFWEAAVDTLPPEYWERFLNRAPDN